MINKKTKCVNRCKLDKGVCVGCNRTMSEIRNWGKMTQEQRDAILNNTYYRGWNTRI